MSEKMTIVDLKPCHISFVDCVYTQNIQILHGAPISAEEWMKCLCDEPDSTEISFIVKMGGENAAWLKLNGLDKPEICISMLVVDTKYQRQGVGSFAVRCAESYAHKLRKTALRIQTTKDNSAAVSCYLKHGYRIVKEIRYVVGDGITRDGYEFKKELHL